MRSPVSVILIRESPQQMTGSGCCGRLDEDDPTVRGRDLFCETRKHRQDLGLLHRAVRRFYPSENPDERVAVVTVDPRNQLYLIAKLFGDVLRYRPGWREGLKTALQMFSLPAVVLNGRVVSRRGQAPDPDAVCHEIGALLGKRG
jgi:hypothetical protein